MTDRSVRTAFAPEAVLPHARGRTLALMLQLSIGIPAAGLAGLPTRQVRGGEARTGVGARPETNGPAAPESAATGYFTHHACRGHDTGPGHPERPERLAAIEAALRRQGLWDRLEHLAPAPAAIDALYRVHDPDYVELARREIAAGKRILSTGDTAVSPESWEAARLAAGAVCGAIDAVLDGRIRNAFCAVRPPGHHARPGGGMGFCVFNNVAIGARHALAAKGLRRVLIVDWDVHHGNGTQDAFWTDGAVLQFHTQQRGIYPGTGAGDERGADAAAGQILNFPLDAGSGIEAFERLYRDELAPAARGFRPQLILVSAGYDAHADDPLGGLALRTEDFGRLASRILDLADELCEGRAIFVLEGGYDLQALGDSAAATIRELLAHGRPPSGPTVTSP